MGAHRGHTLQKCPALLEPAIKRGLAQPSTKKPATECRQFCRERKHPFDATVVVLVQRPPLLDHHAVRLGEQMLNESSTVEEFNEKLKASRCVPVHNVNSGWREQEFGKAKEQITTGEGLGRRFLLHFLGERKRMDTHTVQTVLDTYYAESRKAAAEKRRKEQEKLAAEKAKEQEKQKAEAERKRAMAMANLCGLLKGSNQFAQKPIEGEFKREDASRDATISRAEAADKAGVSEANFLHAGNLEEASSVREALRLPHHP